MGEWSCDDCIHWCVCGLRGEAQHNCLKMLNALSRYLPTLDVDYDKKALEIVAKYCTLFEPREEQEPK